MKLATLNDGSRDGKLIVVKRDGSAWTDATDIAATLQSALDRWEELEARLLDRSDALEQGLVPTQPMDVSQLHSPLPRAYEWVDGSAYINHIVLVRKARGAEPPETLETDPLVYQGGSSHFLTPTENIPLVDASWGLDFEAEVAVILGDTPIGAKSEDVEDYVRLLVLVNDLTWRNLIPPELAKSFGFFQSKPATAFSPFAVTPDELKDRWRGGRVHLPLRTYYNGALFGDPEAGPAMHFSFGDLIEHVAKTRKFSAGTILGSGTVSNDDRSRGSSCLAEKRMIEKIETGSFATPFMKAGDTVRIEMLDAAGASIFGSIDQTVVEP